MVFIAKVILKISGWRWVGEIPPEKKYVMLAVPHTSNWDGFWLLCLSLAGGVHLRWMGKHTLLKAPLGWITRPLGLVGIERSRAHNMVLQMKAQFEANEHFILAIPPEGTRSLRTHWKSGFYHIALAADVPLRLGYLDYGQKVGGYGPAIKLTGDVHADMDRIRAFYEERDAKPLRPTRFGPIRLRSEEADEEMSDSID